VLCCAGIWGTRIGRLAGVSIPVQPLAHQYARTTPIAALSGPTARSPIRSCATRTGRCTSARTGTPTALAATSTGPSRCRRRTSRALTRPAPVCAARAPAAGCGVASPPCSPSPRRTSSSRGRTPSISCQPCGTATSRRR
jgi:hypothetical protein